ncbi:MAG: hypothetical protein R3E95_10980 [Thiolinea sp.]
MPKPWMLLIAGDITTGHSTHAAVEQVDEVLHTLCVELGIRCCGHSNHDSAVRLGFSARQLYAIHHILGLSAEPEAVLLDDGRPVAFTACPTATQC